ncbi:hypothetical protein B7463_g4854, partial [Scytalidium lignicola]
MQQTSNLETISAVSQQQHREFEDIVELTSICSQLENSPDAIDKKIISLDVAGKYLQIYRTHASYFPFVVIHPHDTLYSLRQYKPFLLLSILTVSAKSNSPHQRRLEIELRQTLGTKVIVNGEKSLDLLQGLLVYLCWYHYYFDPERQQLYQLYKLAIAMAEDLEIMGDGLVSIHSGGDKQISPHTYHSSIEARRTFLGTYYISSCLSLIFKKRNNLQYTDYVDRCCRMLAETKEAPSDHLLRSFIGLQRLKEEINHIFDYDNYQQLPFLDSTRISVLVKMFHNQLKQLETSFSTDIWTSAALKMAQLNAQIYINEIGFYTPQTRTTASDAIGNHDWNSSIQRSETLQHSIDSVKKYLDEYLVLPVEELRRQTIVEESQLVYAISILGKFTSGVWAADLDAAYFRKAAKFNHYMVALIERLGTLITFAENGQEQVDFFWHFRRILQHTKKLYEPQINGGYFTTIEKSGLPDACIELSFNKILLLDVDPKHRTEECDSALALASQDTPQDNEWTFDISESWLSLPID